ncbi:uncharacterized protein LOC117611928 isoform X2 [Osmia lignaria lignaria]|uniref:uncharacterized protein LOC117611928 isoform X2 n=1 Tax=Osmia lignaria lignaria TaxID=1437193 RepID=UPI00402BA619
MELLHKEKKRKEQRKWKRSAEEDGRREMEGGNSVKKEEGSMANDIKEKRQRIRVNLEAANAEKPTEVRDFLFSSFQRIRVEERVVRNAREK